MFAKYSDQASLFECLLAMVATGTTALILSLLGGLQWQGSIMVMASVTVLIGGIVYSLLEMYRLGYPVRHSETARTRQDWSPRILRNTVSQQSAEIDEACFHHENHPESSGEDQGQLLSHLPGSTPFLERLD